MGSAASTLDNPMSIYPPQSLPHSHTARDQSPLGDSTKRGSIGLSGPLAKVDLASRESVTSTLVKGKGKAQDEEKEEGEISDDEIQGIPPPPSYPLPARQSDPIPPRGQPIDRTRGGTRRGSGQGGRTDYAVADGRDRSVSRERDGDWEEYRNSQRRPSVEEDDRRASGSRARRRSPSYHPYAAQSAPAPYRPPYRPPPPKMPQAYARPPPPARPPSVSPRPPASASIRRPYPPTAPRGLQPSPPVAFRPGPSSIPVTRPAFAPAQPPPMTATPGIQASPGQVAAAPANISPDEAKQYMSLIRNLLQDGVTPEQLVRQGATPQYVTAVCEEIVEGQKRRKSLWMGTNAAPSSSMSGPPVFPPTPAITAGVPGIPPPPLAPPPPPVPQSFPGPTSVAGLSSIAARPMPSAPQPEAELGDASRPIIVLDSSAPTSRAPSIRSPSPQIQVLRSVQMDRRGSLSSEGSAERALLDSSPSPPRRFVASSHWAPPVRPVAGPSSRAIKIESYKPPSPAPEPMMPLSQPSASGASGSVASRPSAISANGKLPPSGPRSAGLYRRNSNITALSQSAAPVVDVRSEGSASANKRARHISPDRTTDSSTAGSSASRATTGTVQETIQHVAVAFAAPRHPLPEKPFLDLSIQDDPRLAELVPQNRLERQVGFPPTFMLHPSLSILPDQPAQLPPPPVTAADLASKNAVLEARRRALESMRARRKKKEANVDGSASPMDMDIEIDTPTTAAITIAEHGMGGAEHMVDGGLASGSSIEAVIAAEKTIEDEVADLEQEVMDFQTALDRQEAEQLQGTSGHMIVEATTTTITSVPDVSTSAVVHMEPADINDIRMEVDEPEEGELPPEDPIPPLPLTLGPIPSTASSSRRSRNRPGAEDLDSRPTTAPSRARRKPFGAPQRANKLIIALDESDSDSEPDTPNDQLQRRAEILRRLAEEKQNSPMPFPIGSPSFVEGMRSQQELDALADHEEKIKALKAQIAAKMKAKEAARLAKEAGASEGGSSRGNSVTPEEGPTTGQTRSGAESPLKQEVGLPVDGAEEMVIKQEMVEIQTVVEAAVMEVDGDASTDTLALPTPLPAAPKPANARSPTMSTLQAEARVQEDADRSPLDDRSPFAVPQAPPVVHFAPYSGILSRYPQLSSDALSGSVSGLNPAGSINTSVAIDDPATTSSSILAPRREVLRAIMLTRITDQDPNASLCSAEVGGGTCADPSCSSIHFDLDLNPTPDDLVEYVFQSGPDSLERSTVKRAVDLVLKMNPPVLPKSTSKKGKAKGKGKAVEVIEPVPTAEARMESLTLTLSKISHALGLAAR